MQTLINFPPNKYLQTTLKDGNTYTVCLYQNVFYKQIINENNIVSCEIIDKDDIVSFVDVDWQFFFTTPITEHNKKISYIRKAFISVYGEYLEKETHNETYRNNLEYYMYQCENFINSYDDAVLVGRRYLAGKRKITPPFTRKRKEEMKKVKKATNNVPKQFLDFLSEQVNNDLIIQYKNGNEKAINAFVGQCIKFIKQNSLDIPTSAVKEIIVNYYSL